MRTQCRHQGWPVRRNGSHGRADAPRAGAHDLAPAAHEWQVHGLPAEPGPEGHAQGAPAGAQDGPGRAARFCWGRPGRRGARGGAAVAAPGDRCPLSAQGEDQRRRPGRRGPGRGGAAPGLTTYDATAVARAAVPSPGAERPAHAPDGARVHRGRGLHARAAVGDGHPPAPRLPPQTPLLPPPPPPPPLPAPPRLVPPLPAAPLPMPTVPVPPRSPTPPTARPHTESAAAPDPHAALRAQLVHLARTDVGAFEALVDDARREGRRAS